MKKTFALCTLLLAATFAVQAQGGFQRRTVEERVQAVHAKIDSAFKPDAAKLKSIDQVFTTYYTGMDKIREEARSGGERPDMEAMRAKMQPLTDARDKELKTLLTEDQFKKFKDDIEPSMRPQRRRDN